jgi:hypothetical protein
MVGDFLTYHIISFSTTIMDVGSSLDLEREPFEREPIVLSNGKLGFWVGGKYRKRDAVQRFKRTARKVKQP